MGIHDDFFDLGGHSLTATTIVSRVRDALHVDVPLQCFFADPTVAGLAKIIEKTVRRAKSVSAPYSACCPRASLTPFIFPRAGVVHSAIGY